MKILFTWAAISAGFSRSVSANQIGGCVNTEMVKPPPFWERVAGACTTRLVFVRAALCAHAREGELVHHGLVGRLFP